MLPALLCWYLVQSCLYATENFWAILPTLLLVGYSACVALLQRPIESPPQSTQIPEGNERKSSTYEYVTN
jgi:hypothetical protein